MTPFLLPPLFCSPLFCSPFSAPFTNAFGAYDRTRAEQIAAGLQNAMTALNGNLTFNNIPQSDPLATAFAYVQRSVPGVINLGTAYWDAPSTGNDSKAGTIVHEVSHLVAGTSDLGYGSAALNLARTNPAQAINNADNYEYYIERFLPNPGH